MGMVDAIVTAFFFMVGAFGYYFIWREWKQMRQETEEHKRRIRELADEYMEERER